MAGDSEAHSLVRKSISHRGKELRTAVFVCNANGIRGKTIVVFGRKGGIVSSRAGIKEFSSKSRRRLMSFLRSLDWSVLSGAKEAAKEGRAFFVTLTYAEPGTGASVKIDLDRFLKRLRRRYPNGGGLWKMENQEKRSRREGGAFMAHYHLLVDCKEVRPWDEVRRTVAAAWKLGRIDVWTVYGKGRRLMAYLGKYLGKESGGIGKGFGRYWGKFGELPIAPKKVVIARMPEVLRLLERAGHGGQYVSEMRRGMRMPEGKEELRYGRCMGLSLDGETLGELLVRAFGAVEKE